MGRKLRYNEREYPCTPTKKCCLLCRCFEIDEPYIKNKILLECQHQPPTLYELASRVVNAMRFPPALFWTVDQVVKFIVEDLGFPDYKLNMLDNRVNGRRLLFFENPSYLPKINITHFEDIKIISAAIRKLYGTEMVRFGRSIGLPSRYPWSLILQFKSMTGPRWGFIECTTNVEVLELHKICDPDKKRRNHWDMVWYVRPEFPKMRLGKTSKDFEPKVTPPLPDVCQEYKMKRKFRLMDVADEHQFVWTEYRTPRTIEDVQREALMRRQEIERREAIRARMRLRESRYRPGYKRRVAEQRRGRSGATYDAETSRKTYERFECLLAIKYPDAYLDETMAKLALVDERNVFEVPRVKITPCEFPYKV